MRFGSRVLFLRATPKRRGIGTPRTAVSVGADLEVGGCNGRTILVGSGSSSSSSLSTMMSIANRAWVHSFVAEPARLTQGSGKGTSHEVHGIEPHIQRRRGLMEDG